MSTPKIDPLTSEQKTAMAKEISDLRLRAEHGLLKRLALMAEHEPMGAGEAATGLLALSVGGETALGAVFANAFVSPGSRR